MIGVHGSEAIDSMESDSMQLLSKLYACDDGLRLKIGPQQMYEPHVKRLYVLPNIAKVNLLLINPLKD